jgi:hypothetical protein
MQNVPCVLEDIAQHSLVGAGDYAGIEISTASPIADVLSYG